MLPELNNPLVQIELPPPRPSPARQPSGPNSVAPGLARQFLLQTELPPPRQDNPFASNRVAPARPSPAKPVVSPDRVAAARPNHLLPQTRRLPPRLPHFGSNSVTCVTKIVILSVRRGKKAAKVAMLVGGWLGELRKFPQLSKSARPSPNLLPFQAASTGSRISSEMKSESLDESRPAVSPRARPTHFQLSGKSSQANGEQVEGGIRLGRPFLWPTRKPSLPSCGRRWPRRGNRNPNPPEPTIRQPGGAAYPSGCSGLGGLRLPDYAIGRCGVVCVLVHTYFFTRGVDQ